jgi:hypothetical protein
MPHVIHMPTRTHSCRLGRLAWLAASAAGVAALAPAPAGADRVYHSEHLELAAFGGAPLRSGFVENIKAEGPQIYAHEIFVLNGARARSTYTVTRDFFFQDPACAGSLVFHDEDIATLRTNASGNARSDVIVVPGQIGEGLAGTHGVIWTIRNAAGTVTYATRVCAAVTLD